MDSYFKELLFKGTKLIEGETFFFFFWPHPVACGILVPQPRMEPTPPAES